MNYVLTEEEFNRLYAVRGQLRMLASLLCAGSTRTNGDTLCRPADLGEFMDAQSEVLTELERSIEARFEAQRQADQMQPSDWLHLIRIISGEEDKAPGDSAASIDSKLRASAQIDGEMGRVHGAWLDALVLVGERGRLASAPSTPHPAAEEPGQSQALAEYVGKAPPSAARCVEIGNELLELKGVSRHGKFLARLSELGIGPSAAQRFMRTAKQFADAELIVAAAATQTKLVELLALDDAQITALEKTGSIGHLSLAEIEAMNTKELRAAIRKARSADQPSDEKPMATSSIKPRRKRDGLAAVPA